MTDSGTEPSGKSYADRIVAMSLPLPVGADMIALAILVVAVSGSMLLDELLGVAVPAALGAMVVSVALNCEEKGVGTLFGGRRGKVNGGFQN